VKIGPQIKLNAELYKIFLPVASAVHGSQVNACEEYTERSQTGNIDV
jgi:hypothetical protein